MRTILDHEGARGVATRAARALVVAVGTAAPVLLVPLASCEEESVLPPDAGDAAIDLPANGTVVLHPDAPPIPPHTTCEVVIQTGVPLGPVAEHFPPCTALSFSTNPPCGGSHWALWAAYDIWPFPLPRGYYVHNLEHGAVALLYRCEGGCPDVVQGLTEVMNAFPADGMCSGQPHKARLLLTPDPLLDVPIAAAAWGATYRATCLDKPSLAAFAAQVYGKSYEHTCANGFVFPDGGPLCPDGEAPADAAVDAPPMD